MDTEENNMGAFTEARKASGSTMSYKVKNNLINFSNKF